jgi:tetratricopeptide (TPR) repeat protein
MNKLLEIFGRAITVDTADLIWHWLSALINNSKSQDGQAVDETFHEVIELMGNKELENAQEKLKFYLFENPECVFGRMAAVAICLQKNEIAQSIEQLQSIYLRQPSNTMALYTLGYCHERLGNKSEAVEFYQDCLKFKSHLQLPRQRLAAIYFNDQRLDRAIQEYALLTTEHPEDITSMVLLGFLYIAANHFEDAVDTFNAAILAHPDNFNDDNPDDQVEEWLAEGQTEKAIEYIQNQLETVGPMADLLAKMADVLSRSGREAEAIVHYENALRVQPNYLEATIKLGTHYLRFQRPALAAEQFNRAMEINDEIVDAYIGLAIAQDKAGETDDSYKTLSLASAIQQNSTLLFSQTAVLHLETTVKDESPDQAESILKSQQPGELIEEVIKAHQIQMKNSPKSPDIHYKFGLLMMIVGDNEQAIRSFENSLELNPTHHRVRCKLALCLYETGQQKAAVEKLAEPLALDPNVINLHYQTAILYCDKRKFAEALCSLENTMKDNLTEPDALVNIEVVLENLGLVDRAHATWDRLTEAARNAISVNYE